MKAEHPYVASVEWTLDEVAWAKALADLPPEGGTIRVPAGRYVAKAGPWRIMRDRIHVVGADAATTVLETAPGVADGLVLSGYRHVGWKGAYPFAAGDGAKGSDRLRLMDPVWSPDFASGDLVFIRNGACRYDQDFGELNEVANVGADGTLVFRLPFGRAYTSDRIAWAGRTAEVLTMPAVEAKVALRFARGEGLFLPNRNESISIGGALLDVAAVADDLITVRNPGRGNPPAGTAIPSGAAVAKSRAVIRLTATTRGFRAEGVTVRGRRKALTISNSWDSAFERCVFIRDASAGGVEGGIVLDGDDGRLAVFRDCTFRSMPAKGMQVARSFGDLLFERCRFEDTDIALTEFAFRATVRGCTIVHSPGAGLAAAAILGKSCNDLLFEDSRIEVGAVGAVFDGLLDIQSNHDQGDGPIVIRRNVIVAPEGTPRFRFPSGAQPEHD